MATDDKDPDLRHRAQWSIEKRGRQHFKTRAEAERYLNAIKERFKAACELADIKIWTSIDIIYLTRWDCRTARLAAA